MTSVAWFASDFAAEIGVRNYPRMAVFSGDLRGAVHARSQCPSPSVEAVRGDQVGDLLAGDRGRDQPGRGRPQVAHRRIDGDRDTAHGQGRRLGCAGTQTGTTWHATRLAVGGGTGGDRAADRGGQGAGDRAVGRAGKIRLGLSGPVPARVPADVKEAVLKSVDDAVAAGLAHTWVCGLWQATDSRLHRWRVRRRDTGTLVDRAPGGHPVHALLSEEIAAIRDVAERWGTVDRSPSQAGPPRLLRASGVGLAVHVPPRPDRTPAHPARAGTAHPDREAAVAGLAGMGTEPDMDLGCNTFHPRPSGLLRDRGHGLP